MGNPKVFASIVLMVMSVMAFAGESMLPQVDIKRSPHWNSLPRPELSEKRLFVTFDGSPKMTKILQEKLRAKGLTIVEDAGAADETFKFSGIFSIAGGGKEEVKGKLGELLESSVTIGASNTPDYRHQNIDLIQIAGVGAFTGSLSVTDMVRWIGQKTGIAGRFNEMLTGDPRGFCWAESCSKFTSTAILSVNGSAGHWWIQEVAQEPKVVLDIVIADAIENATKPLYDLIDNNVGKSPQ